MGLWDFTRNIVGKGVATVGNTVRLPELGISEALSGNKGQDTPFTGSVHPGAAIPSFNVVSSTNSNPNASQYPYPIGPNPQGATLGASTGGGYGGGISAPNEALSLIDSQWQTIVNQLDEQIGLSEKEANLAKEQVRAGFENTQALKTQEKETKLAGIQQDIDTTLRDSEKAIYRTVQSGDEAFNSLRSKLGVVGALSSSAFAGLGEKIYVRVLEQTGDIASARDSGLKALNREANAAETFYTNALSTLAKERTLAEQQIDLTLQKNLANLRGQKNQATNNRAAQSLEVWENYRQQRASVANAYAREQASLDAWKAKQIATMEMEYQRMFQPGTVEYGRALDQNQRIANSTGEAQNFYNPYANTEIMLNPTNDEDDEFTNFWGN